MRWEAAHHYDVRSVCSEYICPVEEYPYCLNKFNFAVLYASEYVHYRYNEHLNSLVFPISVYQHFLLAVENLQEATPQELLKSKSFLESTKSLTLDQYNGPCIQEIFPFSLLNHILCKIFARDVTNVPAPIVLCEDCPSTCLCSEILL